MAITVAALVNGLRTDGSLELVPGPGPSPDTVQPQPQPVETERTEPATEPLPDGLPSLLPLPGRLREAGGIIWWSDEDCRAGSLELASGAVEFLPERHCRIWPSPDGARAVALSSRQSDMLEGRGLVLAADRRGTLERVVTHAPGSLASEVSWAPDGSSFATCFAGEQRTFVEVFRPPASNVTIDGACFPAFLPNGRLTVAGTSPAAVVTEGKTVIGQDEIERLLPSLPPGSRRAVSALGLGPDGRLAVGLAVVPNRRAIPSSSALAVLSPTGEVEFSAPLVRNHLPAAVGLAPRGDALWYYDAGAKSAVVVNVPGGLRARVFDARWVAWSPSGDYLAAATGDGIAILTWPDLDEVAVVPVGAADLAWTRSP